MNNIFNRTKKKVNIRDLYNMEKYNPNLDRNNFKISYEDATDPIVVANFREYYAENLPVDVLTWMSVNTPPEHFSSLNLREQVLFANYIINPLLYKSEESLKNPPLVIATYEYEGQALPVLQFNFKEYSFVTKSYDSMHWLVAVKSNHPILVELVKDLFIESHPDFRGFPAEFQFDAFSANNRENFHCWLTKYNLYCFFFLLLRGML